MSEQSRSRDADRYLALLAHRLRTNTEYMAGVLAIYQGHERLSDEALADRLRMPAAMLTRLALCKRPRSGDLDFADQVRHLASYTGMNAGHLASLIRQVEALEAVKTLPGQEVARETAAQPAQTDLGWLAAARDRYEAEESQGEAADEARDKDQHKSE